MGLPGVSARGVAALPAPPPRTVRCQRAAMERGGGGRSPQAQTPTSVQSLGKIQKRFTLSAFLGN